MKTLLKRALTFAVGLCWLGCGAVIGCFLLQYLGVGAGLQFLGLSVSSMTVALGAIHFVGFCAGAAICLTFGLFMCASAVESAEPLDLCHPSFSRSLEHGAAADVGSFHDDVFDCHGGDLGRVLGEHNEISQLTWGDGAFVSFGEFGVSAAERPGA